MKTVKITDWNSPELDIYARLNETQLYHYREPDTGIFIAESPNVILRAINAGYRPISFLKEPGEMDARLQEILESQQLPSSVDIIPVYEAEEEILVRITGFRLTRGLLCAMNRRPLPKVEDLLDGAGRIVVLDHVVNPTNVGAIFRSAAALGMDAVVLTAGCSDPLYRRAARVSMGTVFQIPWTFLDASDHCAEVLKRCGFRTAAMALCEDSIGIDDERLMREEKLAIIMGTEGDGLKPETIAACDYTIKIPMSHGVDSLNVAAAAAVAFWQLGRK